MPSLLEIGLANALCAAVLAALAIIVGRACQRPAVMHGLWLLVLLKLITPPIVPLKLPILPAPEPPPTIVAAAPKPSPPPVDEEPETTGQFLLLPAPEGSEQMLVAIHLDTAPWRQPAVVEDRPVAAAASPPAASSIDWHRVAQILAAGWLGGAISWFLLALVRMARFHAMLRHATPAPVELQERADRLAKKLGLTSCPPVKLVPGPLPPMLWMAVGPPTVYLPTDLVQQLEPAEADSLLAHELAHLRRRDHWVRWLELIVQGVYWWNPLVPLVRRQLQRHEEECCDALVVSVMPPRPYATAIVRTLDFLAGAEPLAIPVSGLTRIATMKRRLTNIMRGGVAGRLGTLGRVGLGALALAALPMLPTLTQASATEPTVTEVETTEVDSFDEHLNDVGEIEAPANAAAPRSIAYSPDGTLLALALEDGGIELRDGNAGEIIAKLSGHLGPVNALAWSTDGSTLASASSDRTVRLWDARHLLPLAVLRGHSNWVHAVTFSPDGRTLASGGYDRVVRLWDVTTRKCISVLRGHSAAVRTLAFAPDGRTLASGSGDATIRLWDMNRRQLRAMILGHADTVRALAFAPDGRTLASGSDDGSVRLWDPESGSERASLTGHSAEVTTLAFAPWGQVLATAGMDRSIQLWGIPDGQIIATLPGPRDGIASLAFAPRSGTLTTLGYDRQLRHQRLARIKVHSARQSEAIFVSQPATIRRIITHLSPGLEGKQMMLIEVFRATDGIITAK